MGTEYFLVDEPGRRVLDIHKAYWLLDLAGQTISIDQIKAAREHPETGDDGAIGPISFRRIESWMEHVGCRVMVLSEHDDLPWEEPVPFRFRPGWECHTAFFNSPTEDYCGWVPWTAPGEVDNGEE